MSLLFGIRVSLQLRAEDEHYVLLVSNLRLMLPENIKNRLAQLLDHKGVWDETKPFNLRIETKHSIGKAIPRISVRHTPIDRRYCEGSAEYKVFEIIMPPWLIEYVENLTNYQPYKFRNYDSPVNDAKEGNIDDYLKLYPNLKSIANKCMVEKRWGPVTYIHLYYNDMMIGLIHKFK